MPAECRLSIITVNFNGYRDTAALIETIPQQPDVEIIVVDNGSRQDEAALLRERYPQITVLRSEENLGFAGGNNLGIKASHGQYLFFINNDTEFRGPWQVGKLMARLDAEPAIGAVCPKIRFAWADNPIQFTGYTPLSNITLRNAAIGFGEKDHGQYDTAHATPYAHGAAMMVRRETVERAGLMPECYFLYYEELDWSLMISRAGYTIWYDPSCTIYHKESQSTGQGSPLRCYYIARNRLLFAKRNIALPTRLLTYAYLLTVVNVRDVLVHLLHGRFSHAGAVVAGLRDFLIGHQNKR